MFAAWKRTRRLRSYVRDDIVDFVAGFHQDYPELPLNFESIFDGVKAMQMLYRRENKIEQVELLELATQKFPYITWHYILIEVQKRACKDAILPDGKLHKYNRKDENTKNLAPESNKKVVSSTQSNTEKSSKEKISDSTSEDSMKVKKYPYKHDPKLFTENTSSTGQRFFKWLFIIVIVVLVIKSFISKDNNDSEIKLTSIDSTVETKFNEPQAGGCFRDEDAADCRAKVEKGDAQAKINLEDCYENADARETSIIGYTNDIKNCVIDELTLEDRRLNANYKKIMSLLSGEKKIVLRNTQREWMKYRDKEALSMTFWNHETGEIVDKIYYLSRREMTQENGQIGELEYESKMKELTKKRADELANMLLMMTREL